MKQGSDAADEAAAFQQELWLGYDGLLVPLPMISALLVYQPVWDRRIMHDYGHVPSDVQAVVLLHDGRALPARRALADLRLRWNAWQAAQADEVSDQDSAADASTDED
ncbi:MAG: hypothetical protein JOZ51_16365 [Chloroflexi bacterium]|nr:hypothetical protein [Chloroflexota bacterium]